jgi:hypothetical protein
MKIATFVFALIAAFAVSPVRAQTGAPVVVELFTSQGCSSCPPADEMMKDLIKRGDVIGLALHVDYWDYIGWKDEYGDPAYTRRQKGYAATGGRRMVYTPQMIVNGQEDVVGARGMELADLINQHKNTPSPVSVSASRDGGSVVISVTRNDESGGGAGPYDVHLVRFTPMRKAHITRGELAGRDFEYVNVVDGWTVVGQWDGRQPVKLSAQIDGDRPAVILVQRPDYGAIVAAARAE